MKIKDKKLILLKSLYTKRFDGNYYNVEEIIGNSVQTNKSESDSIAKELADEGLINIVSDKAGTDALITSVGVEYIEDLRVENYDPQDLIDPIEKEILKSKLDELSERLKKLEVGQQITYDDLMNEMETLKKLLDILGKKDWRQMLKGKLVDAGFGSVVDEVFDLLIETFKDIKLLNG
jgi:tetrahydromethanopterin S-methyltransferase subunit B